MKKLLLKSLVLLCALVVGSSNVWATDAYKLVKNISELSQGDIILITSETDGNVKAMGTYSSGNNVPAVDISINNEMITSLGSTQEITLESKNASGNYTLKQAANQFFFAANSSYGNKNYLKTKSDNAVYWSIAVNTTSYKATVKDETSDCNGRNNLRYNSSSDIYSCYSSGQDDVYIFKKVSTHTLTFSATNGSIAGVDANSTAVASGASVAEGATVTLTATPASGYSFSSWSLTGTGSTLSSTSTNPTTFTMGTADATVTANFVASSTPSIGLSTTSVAATTADTDDIITVTYNNIAYIDAEVLFYESDGTTPADYSSWLDAEINVDNNLYYVIGENTGIARTAYMKVHEKSEDVYSELITVTQEAIVVDAPTINPGAGAVTAGSAVTLSQPAADQIRYTTDGTVPTKTTGTLYDSPIIVTKPITIKAIAIKNDVVSDVAEAAYTITVESPTFNIATGGGSYLEGTGITITSTGNTIYYTIKTDGAEPSNPTNNSTLYTEPIALSSGTNKIKAIAYDAYGNASGVVSRTYKGIAPTTLPFNWAGGATDDFIDLTGVIESGLGDYTNASQNPYNIKLDDTDDYIEIFTNGQPGKVSIGVKMIGGSSTSKIKVQESTNGIEFTDVETLTISGSQNSTHTLYTTKAFATTTRVIKLLFTKGSNVGVGPISIAFPEPTTPTVDDVAHTVTLTTSANMAGWRTFAPIKDDQNYTVDGTTKVYYASATVDGKVTLAEIADGVPANTPVILHQTSGTTITLTETATSITAPGSNLLQVSTTSQNLGTVYRLGYKSAYGVGFYTYTTTSAPAGIIYLSTVNAAHEFLGFDFDGETTGVADVTNTNLTNNTNEFFDLQGRKVAQPTKGLYIVNGRKVIVK